VLDRLMIDHNASSLVLMRHPKLLFEDGHCASNAVLDVAVRHTVRRKRNVGPVRIGFVDDG
jgi:hypothetical protein